MLVRSNLIVSSAILVNGQKKKKKKRYQEMINYPVTLVPFKLNALQTFHVFAFQLITADVI